MSACGGIRVRASVCAGLWSLQSGRCRGIGIRIREMLAEACRGRKGPFTGRGSLARWLLGERARMRRGEWARGVSACERGGASACIRGSFCGREGNHAAAGLRLDARRRRSTPGHKMILFPILLPCPFRSGGGTKGGGGPQARFQSAHLTAGATGPFTGRGSLARRLQVRAGEGACLRIGARGRVAPWL